MLGIPFEAVVAGVAELEEGDPERVAVENARRKAAAVRGEIVLAADTVVALDGRIYGKPRDRAEAERTLNALAGRTHEVVSGISLGGATAAQRTRVTFRPLDGATVRWYVDGGEWRGRAGGYAIQGRGAALVAGIEGEFHNVVGLPVNALLDLLAEQGFSLS